MVGTPEMEINEVKATLEARMVQSRIEPICWWSLVGSALLLYTNRAPEAKLTTQMKMTAFLG